MKKIIFATVAGLLLSTAMMAQERLFEKSKFKDNWYIQLQGGASYTVSEARSQASFGDLITPTVALSVGKSFTPVFGLRLQGSGWQAKSQYMWKDDTYKFKYLQGTVDAMFNLTNLFLPYQNDRMFNLKGFVGLSGVHTMHKNNVDLTGTEQRLDKANMIVPRLGLQTDFMVHNNLSLNLEVSANLLEDRFNGVESGKAYDGMVTALAGITYHFNNRGFKYVEAYDPTLLDQTNAQLNKLRQDLASKENKISDLEVELAKKPKTIIQEKEVEVEEVLMNAVVVFKIGKSDLQDNQEINIFNAAKFFQDNPNYNCVVTGYADKATGNATINQKLSERRAEAVAKVMIEKFGISPTRITTRGSGDKEQPFQNDAWNRVAIFSAVKAK